MPQIDGPPHPLEAKVKVPSLIAFVLALFGLLAAFGLDLTKDQQNAILGVIVAAVPLVVFVAGFLAKHTPRPDLLDQGEILTPDGPMTFGRAVPGVNQSVAAAHGRGALIKGDPVVGPDQRERGDAQAQALLLYLLAAVGVIALVVFVLSRV